MPFEIRKTGDQWCVFNKDTGESKGCSDSEELATKHMAALYANTSDTEDKMADTAEDGTSLQKVATAMVYMPFAYVRKRDENDPDVRTVHGWVSDSAKDLDGQRAEPVWLKAALGDWFPWGNIREMHRPNAVGTAISLHEERGSWFLVSKIADREAVRKIDEDIYKGYSIGVKNAVLKFGDPTAPNGWIVGGTIVEVSIVDRPANPIAKFETIEKALLWKEGEPVSTSEPEQSDDLTAIQRHLAERTVRKDLTLDDDLVPIDQGGTSTCDCEDGCADCAEGCEECDDACNCATKVATPELVKISAPSIAASLGLDELTDAQQFLMAAEIVRNAMLKELTEADAETYAIGYHIENMAKAYDLLMELGRQEVYESGQEIIAGLVAGVRGATAPEASKSATGSDSSQGEDEDMDLTEEQMEHLAELVVAKQAEALAKAATAEPTTVPVPGASLDSLGSDTLQKIEEMFNVRLAPLVEKVEELYNQPADGGPLTTLAKRAGSARSPEDGRVAVLKTRLAELEAGAGHDNAAVRAHRQTEAAGVRAELLKIGAS